MRVLLDTHVLVWYLEGNPNLSRSKRELIVKAETEAFVSIASLWEIAIKTSIGKLKLTRSLTDVLQQLSTQSIYCTSLRAMSSKSHHSHFITETRSTVC